MNTSLPPTSISSSIFNKGAILDEVTVLLKVAAPLIFASLVNMGISITDVTMVSWIGTEALAAGAVASDYYSLVFYLALGIVASVSPLVSQARGAKSKRDVRRYTQQGIWLAFIIGLPTVFLIWHADVAFALVGVEQNITNTALPYAQMMALTSLPMLMSMVWHYFLSAHQKTRAILIIMLISLPINALGNYIFMHGLLGLPEMGLEGVGLSSLLTTFLMLGMFITVVLNDKQLKAYRLIKGLFKVDRVRLKEMFRLGVPMGMANLAELGVFMFSTILMGKFGAEALAAHAVALRLAGLLYSFPLGLAQAVTVRVGYAAGASDKMALFRTTTAGLLVGVAVSVFSIALILIWQLDIAYLYLSQESVNTNTIYLAGSLLLAVAIMQPSDTLGTVCAGALRGIKDTRIPMWLSLFAFWAMGFVLGLVLAFVYDLHGIGIWIGLCVGSYCFFALLFARVIYQYFQLRRQGNCEQQDPELALISVKAD